MIFLLATAPFKKSECGIINVKNWGAKGDGKTDDTKAIQKAINAAPENTLTTIYFPEGIYLLSSYITTKNYLENYFLRIHSNIQFNGEGPSTKILLGNHLFDKKDTSANAHLFYGLYINNTHFSSLVIDMNGSKNLAPEAVIKNECAIFINHGNNITLKNVTIKNNAGRNMLIIVGEGRNITVEKSTFLNGGQYVGNNVTNKYQPDFSFIYCEWDSAKIINNHIEQQNIDIALNAVCGGIELHGSYSYAANNEIIGCNPGIYITSSWHSMEKTTVENNNFFDCLRGISFWVNHPMNNISIKDNFIRLTHSRTWKPYTVNGIETPNGNTLQYDFSHANADIVNNLIITGNNIVVAENANNNDRTAGMVLHSIHNTNISNNTITGMNFGGVIIQGSKSGSEKVEISKNKFIDFKTNYDTISPAAYIVVFDSYILTASDAPGVKQIIIKQNNFIRNSLLKNKKPSTKKSGEFFSSFTALPEYMRKEIQFEDNYFSDKTEISKFIPTK